MTPGVVVAHIDEGFILNRTIRKPWHFPTLLFPWSHFFDVPMGCLSYYHVFLSQMYISHRDCMNGRKKILEWYLSLLELLLCSCVFLV